MENIIYLIFALLAILIIAFVAFRNSKPTINNYGTIHNHYHGQDKNEELEATDDDKLLAVAQYFGEILKTIRQDSDKTPPRKNRRLKP